MLIQTNPVQQAMIHHEWIFPAAECVHIVCFALSIGTIAVVDISLLGWGLPRKTASRLLQSTGLWTLVGLVLVIFSGFLIFLSDPAHYLINEAFLLKITCLTLAIVFNYTIHRKVAMSKNESPVADRLVAGVSLALWISIVFSGLFIAFSDQLKT